MKHRVLGFLMALLAVPFLSGCFQNVPAGNVGVKVYLLGKDKGVDHEVLSVGRYWIGINEQLYLFPVYQQNYAWTASLNEGKAVDESFTFQTQEGLTINADVGVSYQIDPNHVADLYQKFHQGPEEITGGFLRNIVRDELNKLGAQDSIAGILGSGKQKLFTAVQQDVAAQLAPVGIKDLRLYLLGDLRLPPIVKAAIDSKITATQKAQQAENELQQTRAEAAKKIAEAEGQARANELKQKTLTPELIQWEAIQKWDGHLPQVTCAATPFINLK